jgi:uncharacterized membrane protein
MNKSRLEAFSDGVFSIVMTLLIFNIKVPVLPEPVTNNELWGQLGLIWPSIVTYAITFAVLSALWINHHYLFHSFAKAVDRRLNLLNLVYLMFVAFVPFSSNFIGSYSSHQPAAIVYGLNIFCIVFLSSSMVTYIKNHPDLFNEELSQRTLNQANFRSTLSLTSYAIGLACSFVFVPLSLFFFLFPIIFNIIPGSLDFAEHVFRFSLD